MSTTHDFTIALSVSRILERVYAASAAEHITSGVDRPTVLGTGQEAMLCSICRDVIAGLIFAISSEVCDTTLGDNTDTDIIEVRLTHNPSYINLTLLSRNFEITIAAGVLAVIWKASRPELSAVWRSSYEESCACLRDLLRRGPANILPTDLA